MRILLFDLKNSKIITYLNVNIESSDDFVSKILQYICTYIYVNTQLLNTNFKGYSLKYIITIKNKQCFYTRFEYDNNIASFPINVIKGVYSKIRTNTVIIVIEPVL
uniref:Uncharacterized protein n=1 Tax=Chrysoporthe deuterocubensis TaxID=764597 RepID=A0A191MX56_9PEZI|nr:hypothetical protein [Chrysoporthe deuterocubensis]AMX22189.1 hypothetical protein [Chrysoporthe deuterocubensis]